jgi:hypothetical protein
VGFLSGPITFRKFRIEEPLSKNFKDAASQSLARHAFREINPKTNPEMSIGWVNAFDPVDTRLGLDKVLFGKYVILGVRKDRKSLSAALMKARMTETMKAHAREHKGRKLSPQEIVGMRETIKIKMLAEVTPSTTFYEMVWNYETQEVFFSALGSKICSEFADLFQETFELTLTESSIASRAEALIDREGLGLDLSTVEAAHFGL